MYFEVITIKIYSLTFQNLPYTFFCLIIDLYQIIIHLYKIILFTILVILFILLIFVATNYLFTQKLTIMKLLFIVISDDAVVMGVYSDECNAIACKEFFEDKLPNSKFSIVSEYVDLIVF